jgi:hypothetical protein
VLAYGVAFEAADREPLGVTDRSGDHPDRAREVARVLDAHRVALGCEHSPIVTGPQVIMEPVVREIVASAAL